MQGRVGRGGGESERGQENRRTRPRKSARCGTTSAGTPRGSTRLEGGGPEASAKRTECICEGFVNKTPGAPLREPIQAPHQPSLSLPSPPSQWRVRASCPTRPQCVGGASPPAPPHPTSPSILFIFPPSPFPAPSPPRSFPLLSPFHALPFSLATTDRRRDLRDPSSLLSPPTLSTPHVLPTSFSHPSQSHPRGPSAVAAADAGLVRRGARGSLHLPRRRDRLCGRGGGWRCGAAPESCGSL